MEEIYCNQNELCCDGACTKPACVTDSDCGGSGISSGWVCVRPGICSAECRQYWIKEEKQSVKAINDGYVFLNTRGTLTKSNTGYLAVGPRNGDCFKFRSWMDFDISAIPDNAKIIDVKLFLSTHYMDNPQNRQVIITKIDQNQPAGLIDPSTLWSDTIENLYVTLTDFTSTSQESWKTQGIDLGDAANFALQEKLAQNFFSVGIAMPDESCIVQYLYRPTHAYLDFFSAESGFGPILQVSYS